MPEYKTAKALLRQRYDDAYSVYGRFEGQVNGGPTDANIGLGKIFSTGVASQRLATGLGKYYENIGVAECYKPIAALAGKIPEDQLKKMIAQCLPQK